MDMRNNQHFSTWDKTGQWCCGQVPPHFYRDSMRSVFFQLWSQCDGWWGSLTKDAPRTTLKGWNRPYNTFVDCVIRGFRWEVWVGHFCVSYVMDRPLSHGGIPIPAGILCLLSPLRQFRGATVSVRTAWRCVWSLSLYSFVIISHNFYSKKTKSLQLSLGGLILHNFLYETNRKSFCLLPCRGGILRSISIQNNNLKGFNSYPSKQSRLSASFLPDCLLWVLTQRLNLIFNAALA